MKWYSGNIAEAVQHSKKEGAVFFVAIFGDNEQSKKLEEAVESAEIQSLLSSTRFVCIRLTADSQEHLQFKQIYSNAESPCLYFISLMGAPVEIIHGDAAAEELKQRCESAWEKHSKVLESQKAPPPTQVVQESQSASTSQNSGNAPGPSSSRETTPSVDEQDDADTANMTLEQKIERARQLAAARAQLKLEEEAAEERKREVERREAGKGMAEMKRWQEEQEAKQRIEERKRDKREEQLLRQKLREQIAQDRAERNKRTNASFAYDGAEQPSTSSGSAQKPSVISSTPVNYAGKARLQFRMPNGSSQNHNFDQDVTLGHVRNFLTDGQHVKFSNFSLCVAFPRRMFTSEEYNTSLKDLGLLPSAALLVIPAGGNVLSAASGNQGSAIWLWLTTLLGYLLFPVTYLFGTLQRALPSSGGSGGSSTQPPKPSTSTGNENRLGGSGAGASYRAGSVDKRNTGSTAGQPEDLRKRNVKSEKNSDGNIHRLRNQETDSDEDLGTWNGNSTQQKPR